MISIELYKRILTSIILLAILTICIFYNKSIFLIFLFLIGVISTYEWFLIHKKSLNTFFSLGLILLLISLFSAYKLRGDNFENIIFFLWILFICFFSDTGGYIFGKIIGGKKLTKISPNKTLAGTIGSIVFSFFPIFIINYQVYLETNLKINFTNLLLSFFISIICQLGDLFISYIKRLKKIKDTGNVLPGHGGMLDRIDGIIFVLPVVFFLKFIELL